MNTAVPPAGKVKSTGLSVITGNVGPVTEILKLPPVFAKSTTLIKYVTPLVNV